ncbi:MAG: hypothetical protein HKN23_04015 [Verrucomicrobiales bacterium]|nr:hypothetical protein [Verrucomicrobiales bacterium]
MADPHSSTDDGSLLIAGVGQAGCQMAAAFWARVCRDHQIDPDTGHSESGPTGRWDRLFSLVGTGSRDERYVPRCLFVDSDPRTADELKRKWRELLNPANFVTGEESSGNNFAVAFREVNDRLSSDIRDVLDREFRKPPAPTGFIVFQGFGGGSGSGLAAGLFEILKSYAPSAPILSVGVLPSSTVSTSVTEPYNSVFGIEAALRNVDLSLVFHNDLLLNLASTHWEIENPSMEHIDGLIADMVASITGPVRFDGQEQPATPLGAVLNDLAPHPDFPLATGTIFPLQSILRKNASIRTSGQILNHVLEKNLDLCPCTEGTILSLGLYGASRAGIPGYRTVNDAESTENEGIPHFAQLHLSAEPSPHSSICVVVNSSSIGQWLEELCDRFDQLWERKAFANWYLDAGMTEAEIENLRREVGFRVDRYRDI